MTDGLTQDTLRRLRLDKFENINRNNVAETTINTDTIWAAVVAATQADPETNPDSHDVAMTQAVFETELEHHDDKKAAIAKDQLVAVHSDQAPQAPITPCSAAREGAEMPASAEELANQKIPVEQEKYGDRNPAAMTHNDLRSEVEGEGRNNLESGGGEQDPRLNDGIPSSDEGSVAVADVAVSDRHADGDKGNVVRNGDMNIDSIGGLDFETDEHGGGDGDRKIDGDRARDGDQAAAGKKVVEEGLCGTDGEMVSASQGIQGTDEARAPDTSSMSTNDDVNLKAISYDRRIRNREKKMEPVLGNEGEGGKGNTGKGGASWTKTMATLGDGNTPQRSDRHWLQEHTLIQELFRLIVLVMCCTVAIVILSRNGIISLSPDGSRLPVDGLDAFFVSVSEEGGKDPQQGKIYRPNKKSTNIEAFGDVQKRAFILSQDGKLRTCLPEHGGTKEFCQVVAQVVSLGFVVHDEKGDSTLVNAAIKPSRKGWNIFSRKKEAVRMEITGIVAHNKNGAE